MKHAMMIMAHTDFGQLCRLVKALDHDDVDIYVHVNRRSLDWNPVMLDGTTRHSKVFFVDRVNIYYCDYSQVEAQKRLLHAAVEHGYDYYHLLSGADLPIHPMDTILKFFEMHSGQEFVGFDNEYDERKAGYYFFFTNAIRTSGGFKQRLFLQTQKMLLNIQRIFGINYARKFKGEIKKGCDWWSITHSAATYVLEHEPEFRQSFRHTYCPSELLMQTILYNSPLRDRFFNTADENLGSMREIDWTRGQPYVWHRDDFTELKASPCMFARKFDSRNHNDIIDLILEYIHSDQ